MNNRRHVRGRGFVFVAAVLLIALLGAAIGAISGAVAADARRTRDRERDAQLEQLLLAAAADAPAHLAMQFPAEGQSWSLEMPASLKSRDASLQVRVGAVQADQSARVMMFAALDGHRAEQAATFSQMNGKWTLVSAELQPQ